MKTLWTTVAAGLLVGGLQAQDRDERGEEGESVPVEGQVDKNVPGNGQESPDLFRGDVGMPPLDAIPMPELDPANNHPNPDGFQSQAIWLDTESGVESWMDVYELGLSGEQWIAGSDTWGEDEPQISDRAWNGTPLEIDSSAFPWSTACRIYFDDANGTTFVCSGTMIDPQNLITAGHCVHEGNGGTWYSNFRVYPSWDGDFDAYGNSGASSLATFTDWSVNGNFDGDMGFIRLSRPVGFLTSWFGYGWSSDDNFYTSNAFNMAGYPAGCFDGAPDQLYYFWGSYDVVSTYILTADVSWTCGTGGVSGTGVYWINGTGNRYVYGNHSHRCYGCDPNTIGSTRMTQGKYDYFNDTYMPGGYSSTDPDYVPLRVRTSSGTTDFVAGERISDTSYVVANRSLYNPIGTQNYPVDMYLSTNDNISTFDTLINSHSFSWNFGAKSSVTVSFPGGPMIPSDTPTGNYWLGLILNGPGDSNVGNDDTDGWDAQPITVTGCEVGFTSFGVGLAGSGGFVPTLFGSGDSCVPGGHSVHVTNGLGNGLGHMWVGLGAVDIPGFGGRFYVDLSGVWSRFTIRLNGAPGQPGAGWITLPGSDTTTWQGLTAYVQCTFLDPGAINGVSLTPGLQVDIVE